MQREIKFRAWVKKGGAMADWETITKECDRFSLLKDQNFIFMQYTGLKDKTGKEIYEGDILDIKYNYIGKVAVIFKRGEYNISRYNLDKCKVIGNIHENPELLEKL